MNEFTHRNDAGHVLAEKSKPAEFYNGGREVLFECLGWVCRSCCRVEPADDWSKWRKEQDGSVFCVCGNKIGVLKDEPSKETS